MPDPPRRVSSRRVLSTVLAGVGCSIEGVGSAAKGVSHVPKGAPCRTHGDGEASAVPQKRCTSNNSASVHFRTDRRRSWLKRMKKLCRALVRSSSSAVPFVSFCGRPVLQTLLQAEEERREENIEQQPQFQRCFINTCVVSLWCLRDLEGNRKFEEFPHFS